MLNHHLTTMNLPFFLVCTGYLNLATCSYLIPVQQIFGKSSRSNEEISSFPKTNNSLRHAQYLVVNLHSKIHKMKYQMTYEDMSCDGVTTNQMCIVQAGFGSLLYRLQ
ncbi:hypothetical protein KC19_12G106800 [Ceratodon purpureus]|uniref:Uncharacterized protein n=1 Tax=Ceratodon purpureus TaxID=3225 RepID=A0A8T0GBI8_CERPU|nr:hypothetical protein KC19_12G106800 [Ceratodon purpureus]